MAPRVETKAQSGNMTELGEKELAALEGARRVLETLYGKRAINRLLQGSFADILLVLTGNPHPPWRDGSWATFTVRLGNKRQRRVALVTVEVADRGWGSSCHMGSTNGLYDVNGLVVPTQEGVSELEVGGYAVNF